MKRISRESARLVSSLTDSWFTGANIPGKPRAVYFFLGSYGRYRADLDHFDNGFCSGGLSRTSFGEGSPNLKVSPGITSASKSRTI